MQSSCLRSVTGPKIRSDRSVEQRGKKSAESSEEPARRRVIGRCRFRAWRFRGWLGGWRKRSGQSQGGSWTRIERQGTHILYRRRRRAGRVEHKRRLHLHVNFVRRDGGVERGRWRYSGRGRAFRGRRRALRRWVRVQGQRWLALHMLRHSARHFALRGQNTRRSQGWVAWRRTSALERHRHIHTIELPRPKHELVGGLDLIRAIAEQLRNNGR